MLSFEGSRDTCIIPPTEGYSGDDELLIVPNCIKTDFPATFERLRQGKTTIMGCPTEDASLSYKDKILTLLSIRTVSTIKVAVTEKTCDKCLHDAVRRAVAESGKRIPVYYLFIDGDGKVRG